MAQSLNTVETIIKRSYSLQVAVRCTPGAERLCKKNRLTFCELLEPFSHLESPVQSKDLQCHPYTLKNVHVRFSDPQLEPTPAAELQRLLSDAVKEGGWDGKQPLIRYGNITTNATTPWYDGYRDNFLGKLRSEDREPIRHYVSVLLVVSSQETDVMEAFGELYSKQKESEQTRSSNWLIPHMFYYHILLHEGQTTGVEEKLSKVQATYGGGSCFLLKINSRLPGSIVLGDNPWSRVARHYTTLHNSNGEDEPDGLSSKLRFSISGKQKKNKKSPKISPKNPVPQNHSPDPPPPPSALTTSPSSSFSSSTTSTTPPLLPKTSISPPPSLTSNSSLPALPTDTHPLLEDAPANNEIIAPPAIAPNVREEAKLVQSSSEESVTETNEYEKMEERWEEGEMGERGREGGGRAQDDVGQCLSAEDETRVRNFVTEFVAQRLVPHLEAVLKNLNEWLISRRSVRRSISTMSKRFFGMLGGQLNNAAIDEPSYTSSSQEFQTRQFADLLFLLQSYDQAFANYLTVRKDFQSSSAWMHYAKTVEMCAVTAYMLSSTRRDVIPLFEEAINMFATSCKSPVSAMKCSMLQSEVLKERGLYRNLTQICIKMTSEESDLHSAVCLEQAAHAFLRIHPSMARKYGLHLILAGHRFAKSSQRVHSARVYTQALELYRGKGWALAEDYVHFSLARHCFALKRLRDARLAFEHLLSHYSIQSPNYQLLNLREYIYVHKLLLSDTDYCSGQQVNLGLNSTSLTSADRVQSVPLLPIPFVKSSLTRVIFQTGVSSERLCKLTKNYTTEEGEEEEDEDEETERGREVARPIGGARMKQILQQLTESSSNSSSRKINPIIVGARDFNPQTVKGSTEEWRGLEEVAARGPQGTPHENFQPSVVIMNESTDNSRVPHCVVNESVSVGVVLRNPLKVPLVLKNIALTWSHTPLSVGPGSGGGGGGGEVGGGERVRAEVLERIVLQPLAHKMVVLRLTPLCEGELDVLGIICHLCVDHPLPSSPSLGGRGSESPGPPSRASLPSLSISGRDSLFQRQQNLRIQQSLAEGVQGRVEFSVQGPRLNRTKEHKTGVVYGPDHRLHWRVTTPMPRALVSVSGASGECLSGEVMRLKVEVVNCGDVPLNSLRLTSSLASRLLLDTREKVSSPGAVYPSALPSSTPTSSLRSPPYQTPPCIELPLPTGRLEPGRGVSVGVVLHTVDHQERGEVPWNLLFYYEPTLITSHSTMTHRVLQYSHILSVRESLVLKTTATPTQSPATTHSDRFDLNQLVVMLEAENKCQRAVELRILQVSCVSQKWSIQQMDKQQGVVSLFPKESGVVPLKASCHTPSSPGEGEEEGGERGLADGRKRSQRRRQLCFSDVPLGTTAIPSQEFPVLDLVSASEDYRNMVGVRDEEVMRELGGRVKEGETPDTNDIILIVFWQALVSQGSDVIYSYGHHTVPVRLPQSMALLSKPHSVSPSQSPYDLVKHYLDHPASLPHCFSTSGACCQVPVLITLQNCSHSTVQVSIELSHHHKEVPQDQKTGSKHPFPDSNVVWTGATCQRHTHLPPNSQRSLRVFANFTRPGVYNLQTVKVWARREGTADYHLQRWQRTSIIAVVESLGL